MSTPNGEGPEMGNMSSIKSAEVPLNTSNLFGHIEGNNDPKKGEKSNLQSLAEAKEAGQATRTALAEGKDLSDIEIGALFATSTEKLAVYLKKVGIDRGGTTPEPPLGSLGDFAHPEWSVGKNLVDRALRLEEMSAFFKKVDSSDPVDPVDGARAFQYLVGVKESMLQEGSNTDRLKAFMAKVQEKVPRLST